MYCGFFFFKQILAIFLLVFATFYSLPPIRLKEKAPLDAIWNGLTYTSFPFLVGYSVKQTPNIDVLIVAILVSIPAISYYLLLAIQDYEYDLRAGVFTTVVKLGKVKSLKLIKVIMLFFFLCSLLFLWKYALMLIPFYFGGSIIFFINNANDVPHVIPNISWIWILTNIVSFNYIISSPFLKGILIFFLLVLLTMFVKNYKNKIFIIMSPILQALLKIAFRNCRKCNKPILQNAIDIYAQDSKYTCFKCSLVSKIIKFFVNILNVFFHIDKKLLKNYLRNQFIKKSWLILLKGISIWGLKKRPIIPSSPFVVVWDITTKCNLNCKHCYSKNRYKKELDTKEILKIIDKLAVANVPAIIFSGGEPLLRDDILDIIRYATDKGIYVGIATNGTLLDENTAEKLKKGGVKMLQISIDSFSPIKHDAFRGGRNVFTKALSAIRLSKKMGFLTVVATTITRENYNEIEEIILLSKDLGADWFIAFNFIPIGEGGLRKDLDITATEREALLKKLWQLQYRNPTFGIISTAPQFSRIAIQYGKTIGIPGHFHPVMMVSERINEIFSGCGAGTFYCGIGADGTVYPCIFLPIALGNLRFDDIETIWRKNKILSLLRKRDDIKICNNCTFKYLCGGCRSRAYAYYRDFLGPDPGCILCVMEKSRSH